MLKIGLTGGIGSGKSTIGKVFQHLDIPVFDSDQVAKSAYLNQFVIEEIRLKWGDQVFDEGTLNLKKLSQIVFTHSTELAWLESIIHPFVEREWVKFTESNQTSPYIIKESAILLKNQKGQTFDAVIGVIAESSLRIQRVQERSQLTPDQIKARMDNQILDEDIISACQWIIQNNASDTVIPQIMRIHENLIQIKPS